LGWDDEAASPKSSEIVESVGAKPWIKLQPLQGYAYGPAPGLRIFIIALTGVRFMSKTG